MNDDSSSLRRCLNRVLCVGLCALAAITHAATNPQARSIVAAERSAVAQIKTRPLRVVRLNEPDTTRRALELEMLADFARSIERPIEWIDVFRAEEVLEQLLSGDADLAINALPIDHQHAANLRASEPIALRRFRLVGHADRNIESPSDLANKSVAVKLSSPLWGYLDRLRRTVANLRLQVLPSNLTHAEVLATLAAGTYDAALIASHVESDSIDGFPDLKHLFDLTGLEPVSWYAHADKAALIVALNEFIKRFHLAYDHPLPNTRSFEEIKNLGVLRVITRLDDRNYYLRSGRPSGIELELARRFAARHGLRLDVLVGRDDAEILRWLRDGAGDIVTARISDRTIREDAAYEMSREYRYEAALIVSRRGRALKTTADLAGKIIVAYENSPNLVALRQAMGDKGAAIAVSRRVSHARLLARVSTGEVDGVVVDARYLNMATARHRGLVAGMSIPNPYRYRWTLRVDDRPLYDAVDEFLENEYDSDRYDALVTRYEKNTKRIHRSFVDISPFDHLLQIYSNKYGFDWRLIAAQMYQESHFKPDAVSWAGAQGLMQLMPATAASLGVKNPNDPETAIHAGVRYLDHLRTRFDRRIPMIERTWMALAAYNIGFDRVRRARERASAMGLDPNRWFDNVEVAMREMTRSFQATRSGCRCGQAIIYVRAIRSLYYTYRNLVLADGKLRPLPPLRRTG